MGQRCCKPCPLSKEELDDYALLTFLSRAEIISVFSKFQKLDPISVEENRNVRLTIEQVLSGVDELRLSPFGDRICQSFAAENDGKMGFEDFLDMYREAQMDLTTETALVNFDMRYEIPY